MVGQKHTLVEHLILLQVFPSDGISGMFFVWSDNIRIWSDIVRCPTGILRPAKWKVLEDLRLKKEGNKIDK